MNLSGSLVNNLKLVVKFLLNLEDKLLRLYPLSTGFRKNGSDESIIRPRQQWNWSSRLTARKRLHLERHSGAGGGGH